MIDHIEPFLLHLISFTTTSNVIVGNVCVPNFLKIKTLLIDYDEEEFPGSGIIVEELLLLALMNCSNKHKGPRDLLVQGMVKMYSNKCGKGGITQPDSLFFFAWAELVLPFTRAVVFSAEGTQDGVLEPLKSASCDKDAMLKEG